MKTRLYTSMGDYGQYVDAMEICWENMEIIEEKNIDISVRGHYHDLSGRALSDGILEVNWADNSVKLVFDPFVYRYPFEIILTTAGKKYVFSKENMDEVILEGVEDFAPVCENGVHYRLYSPDGCCARPLVLFLHGGGESGEDNLHQLTGTFGPLELAKRFPDMYVMAPQAPGGNLTMEENFKMMAKRGDMFRVRMGGTPLALKGERGWNRDYLARVLDVIRGMIAEGKVDGRRVYVTGLSMGGGGTLQAVSLAPDLFAAAAPICPSMNGESYAQLLHWPQVPIWITTAYMDHQHGRHAYILNACTKLWSEGRSMEEVKFTMYLPEELAEYGIGTTPDLSARELDAENHNSWILTYHNEKGVLNWLFSHSKA